jgi:hypothetical protein
VKVLVAAKGAELAIRNEEVRGYNLMPTETISARLRARSFNRTATRRKLRELYPRFNTSVKKKKSDVIYGGEMLVMVPRMGDRCNIEDFNGNYRRISSEAERDHYLAHWKVM